MERRASQLIAPFQGAAVMPLCSKPAAWMPDINAPHIPSCPMTFIRPNKKRKGDMGSNFERYFVEWRSSDKEFLGGVGWDDAKISSAFVRPVIVLFFKHKSTH